MPSEPSSFMDKLLKAYAQKRREKLGEPKAMHSAVRHQLQEEVTRTFHSKKRSPQPGFLKSILRQLIWATPVLVLGIIAWLAFLPQEQLRKSESSLSVASSDAKEETKAELPAKKLKSLQEPVSSPSAAPALADSASESTLSKSDDSISKEKQFDQVPAAVQMMQQPKTPPSPPAERKSEDRQEMKRSNLTLAPTPSKQERADMDKSVALEEEVKNVWVFAKSTETEKFHEKDSGANKNAGLLTSFKLERLGDQIRIIDSDGSIYTGTIEPAQNVVAKKPEESVRGKDSDGKLKEMLSPSFSFSVSGMNRTLNEVVKIKAAFTQEQLTGAKTGFTSGAPAGGEFRIQGSMTIGNSPEAELNVSGSKSP